MKKVGLFLSVLIFSLLVACGSKDLSEYVDVSFSGIDSIGKAHYTVDENRLYTDLFDFDPDAESPNMNVIEDINTVATAYTITFDNDKNLSNGDTVAMTITVDEDQTKKIKGGEVEFTVEELEDAKDITPYVDVSFSGLDTQGTADYTMNEEELIVELFGNENHDDETDAHIAHLDTSYSIEVKPDTNLSNGDTVTLTIKADDGETQIIKDAEQTFTVKDLDKATELTTEDVEKHLVLNFNGVSGEGIAKMDNTFGSPLNYFNFNIENDGALKNGDEATLAWDEETEQSLNNEGYIVTENFNPTFEVEGLDVVAEKATDIENLDDIKRMIDEEVTRIYNDNNPEEKYGLRYEIELEKLMYRQFNNDDDDGWYRSDEHGHLMGIYSVKKYGGGDDGELKDELTAMIGYSNIFLDEDNKANVSKIDNFSERKDDSYSLKSVIQLYEGYGYTEVEE